VVAKIVELLSPAKDMISLNSAINNGADSIYVGLDGFNMRANAANFSIDQISEAVDICHENGVKLYVCINTSLKEAEINYLKITMPLIKDSGADAVIVSDLGAVKIAADCGIDVHMSVQANITNTEASNLLSKLGVTRTILSRELSIQEIRQIANDSKLDVEVFVHGAMCVAVSGRCFLSSYLYNKSANCGDCLQPCRKEWKIISEDKDEFIIGNEQISTTQNKWLDNDPSTHIMSPKDLCMLEHIPLLIESGVKVFKIEGRARPADYVATVTRIYREAITAYENGEWNSIKHAENVDRWLDNLQKVFNRGFDTGFYFKTPHKTSSSNEAKLKKLNLGEVVNYYNKVHAAEVKLWADVYDGDDLIVQGKTTGSIELKVESMQINGKQVNKAFKGHNVAISIKDKVRPGDIVYKIIPRTD